MANNAVTISIPVKFDIKAAPRGMIDYDPKALSADQQKELNTYKLNIRKESFIYLAQHKEIQAIISLVVRMCTIHRPRNIIAFVGDFFTRPERQLREEVSKILNESKIEHGWIPSSEFEEWDY